MTNCKVSLVPFITGWDQYVQVNHFSFCLYHLLKYNFCYTFTLDLLNDKLERKKNITRITIKYKFTRAVK